MATNSVSSSTSIDVQGLVSQLMQIERQPLAKLQSRVSAIQTDISAFGKVKSALSGLQEAARGLTNLTTWQAVSATSSSESAVGVTASAGAATGNFPIRVDQLARPQSAVSGTFASASTVVGGGTLRIQLGAWDSVGGTFTDDVSRSATSITIAPGATLSDIRAAINSAAPGLSATIVNDGGQARLMLRGSSSGVDNAFRISVTDADGNDTDASGLSALTVHPAGTGNVPVTQQALDAKYNLGGVDLKASSNRVINAIDNVTLDLRQVGASSVDVRISSDTTAMRAAVDKFVAAYNSAISTMRDLTKYDPTNKSGGALQGSSNVIGMLNKLRGVISGVVGTGTLARLSDAGISAQRDGSLSVDGNRFTAAVADPDKLKILFSNSDVVTAGNVGIARRLDSLLTNALGSDGTIAGAIGTLSKQQSSLQKQQDRLNDQLAATQMRLTKLYTTLDANLQKMNGDSSFLSRFNSSNNNNG